MTTTFPLQAAYPPYVASTIIPNHVRENPSLLSDLYHENAISLEVFVLQLLDVWAQAMDFARSLRNGDHKKVWAANGPYQQVMSEVYEVESRSSETFRLRNAKPAERSTSQLNAERYYWAKWFFMQILYHAIQAMINHPFLHIVRETEEQPKQPPSFLQHTVDQTLLHSSWIAKFIGLCDEKGFELHDPFIAHLASVAATVFMFFLDSSDHQLASQSIHGFNTCYCFVKKASGRWPHLQNTVHKLDILQTTRGQRSSTGAHSYTRSGQSTLLWSLLDYSSSTAPNSPQNASSGVIELNAGTQFLSPLNSMDTQPTDRASSLEKQPLAGAQPEEGAGTEAVIDAGTFNHLDIFNPNMFHDFQATSFDAGFWTDFRL